MADDTGLKLFAMFLVIMLALPLAIPFLRDNVKWSMEPVRVISYLIFWIVATMAVIGFLLGHPIFLLLLLLSGGGCGVTAARR